MNPLQTIVCAATLLMLCGCASPPRARHMIYSGKVSGRFNPALLNAITTVPATRGRQLNAVSSAEFDTEAFDAALQQSLRAHALFSDSGRFQLQTHILKIIQPPGRFNMKVTTHIEYTLVESATAKSVFKNTVIADHTAFAPEALTSIKRRRLANEGAGRSNIAHFLEQLSQLP